MTFLNRLLDEIEFEDWFYKLDEILKDSKISQNAIFDYIANNPHYYMMAGKLSAIASKNYEDLKLQYKLAKSKKIDTITRKLEQLKKDKVITRQLTNDFVEQSLIKYYPDFVTEWESQLIDAKEVRDLTKILTDAYQARITGMQSINKKLYEKENSDIVEKLKKKSRRIL